MSVGTIGNLRITTSSPRPMRYPVNVTGDGWDGEVATCHNPTQVRDAIADDVEVIMGDDAHVWYASTYGPTCDDHGHDLPEYSQARETWEAWLIEHLTAALANRQPVRLDVEAGGTRFVYRWWTEAAEVTP